MRYKIVSLVVLLFVVLQSCGGVSSMETMRDDKVSSVGEEQFFHTPIVVDIKYRQDDVDIGHPRFESLNTSKSSWIGGAWYDDDEDYMVIMLTLTYYHYCNLPENTWNRFNSADSFGSDYNAYIKGNYSCQKNMSPRY